MLVLNHVHDFLVISMMLIVLMVIMVKIDNGDNGDGDCGEVLELNHVHNFLVRVAKCHRYGRYICVNFLEVWGKILECNIRASDVG